MQAPLTHATSRAMPAQLVHLADDAADLAVIEAREDLLLELVPRRERRAPRQLGKAALVQQARPGDGRVRMRREAADQRLDRAGRRHRVGIQQQHVVALGGANAEVVGRANPRLPPDSITCTDGHCCAHVRRGAVGRLRCPPP